MATPSAHLSRQNFDAAYSLGAGTVTTSKVASKHRNGSGVLRFGAKLPRSHRKAIARYWEGQSPARAARPSLALESSYLKDGDPTKPATAIRAMHPTLDAK